jgi:hypothetical protein
VCGPARGHGLWGHLRSGSGSVSGVVMPGRVRPAAPGLVHRTRGISCERSIRSTLVSFIPLFDGVAHWTAWCFMRRSVTAPGVCPTLRRRERRPGSGCNGLRAAGHVRASVGPTRGKGPVVPSQLMVPDTMEHFAAVLPGRVPKPHFHSSIRPAENHDTPLS